MPAARALLLPGCLAATVAACGGGSSSGATRSQFGGTAPGAEARPAKAPSPAPPPETRPTPVPPSQFGGTGPRP